MQKRISRLNVIAFQMALILFICLSGCTSQSTDPVPTQSPVTTSSAIDVEPRVTTDQVGEDADDPAIWVHPADPSRSLILGTNKILAPSGALVVFGLDGKIRQTLEGLDRPNNVDVEYGLDLGGQATDIAVLTERYQKRLQVFSVAPDGSGLTDVSSVTGLGVFEGEEGERSAPMGIALYRPDPATVQFSPS